MRDKNKTKEQLISKRNELRLQNAELGSKVTEHKNVEDTLKESEEIFRLLSEQSLIGIAILQDDQFRYLSQATSNIIEYSVDEMLNWKPNEYAKIFHPDDRTFIMEQAKKKQVGEKDAVTNYECRVITKQGKIKTTEIYSKPIVFRGKSADFVTILDITERKLTEKNLHESEMRYREMFNSAADSMFVLDHAGNIVDLNRAACNTYGYTRNELIGSHATTLITPEYHNEFRRYIETLQKEGNFLGSTIDSRKDGTKLNTEVHGSIVHIKGKPYLLAVVRNITERKQAEQALQKSEEQFRSLVEATSDFIWTVDSRGMYTFVSPKVEEMLGYKPEEMIGKTPFDLMPADEAERISEKFFSFVKEKKPFKSLNNLNIHKDGRLVTLETSGVPIFGSDGNLLGYRGIDRDITERKLAENELIETKKHLENLIEISLDPIIIGDNVGHITKPNRAFLEMIGYTEEEVVGKMTYEFSIPEEGPYESTTGEVVNIDEGFFKESKAKIEELFERGMVSNWVSWYVNKEKKVVPITQNIVFLFSGKGERIVFLGIIRDITQQRKAELGLIRSKEDMENLIETSLDPIVVGDSTGHITKPNKSFLEMVGYTEEEVVGEPVFKFSVTDEGTYESTAGETVTIGEDFFQTNYEKIDQLFQEKKLFNWVTYYLNKNNKVIPITQNILFLYNERGERTGSFGIIRDITQQKKAERELIEAKETAEEASQAKSIFLANMSHEIRTPMNAVIGFTDMLLDTGLDTEQEDYSRTIKQSGESLLSLLNDILDFSKVEAGKIDMKEVDFDIEVLAYDVCELIRPRLGNKDVEILCRIDDNLPAWIKGDPQRIKQIFLNMMGNASKFTDKGEIELSLEAEEEQDGQLMIHTKVRDTGTGIPQDKIESIFEIFQQVDGSTSRKYGGTGLGLSICRKIANLMGGNVWAESEMGKGSTFHFTALLNQPDKKDVKRFAPVSLSGKKVLITDDNIKNLEILTHALESAGMRAASCSNGEESLKAIKDAFKANEPFDICILDIMMPGMDGYELAKRIRSSASESTPLIAFSSTIEMGGASESQEAGFNGFLPKPINRIKLFKMMELLLGKTMNKEKLEEKETKLVTQYSMREDAKHATTILLAEDNPVNQKLATKLLTKAGYKVDVAGNGKEAVEKFTAAPEAYDIILMDVQMPELSGLEATRLLREKGYTQVPIVAMTAEAMKGDKEKCLASGMNDYIAKPIKREVVFETLRKWVIEKE